MAASVAVVAKTTDLLVLQPTPLCNLDGRYCYLPDRASTKRMTLGTLERALRCISVAGQVGEYISIIWHAGEPLVVPKEWYAEAFSIVDSILPRSSPGRHHFQTNGTLIDEAWCDSIIEQGIRVGVSIDGPDVLHNLSYPKGPRHSSPGHVRCLRCPTECPMTLETSEARAYG